MVRQERSLPVVEALHGWLTAQLARVSGKSALAEALRYALRHWPGLVLFLEDGRLELDTNTVERAIRPIALGRKNTHDRLSRMGTTGRVRSSARPLPISEWSAGRGQDTGNSATIAQTLIRGSEPQCDVASEGCLALPAGIGAGPALYSCRRIPSDRSRCPDRSRPAMSSRTAAPATRGLRPQPVAPRSWPRPGSRSPRRSPAARARRP